MNVSLIIIICWLMLVIARLPATRAAVKRAAAKVSKAFRKYKDEATMLTLFAGGIYVTFKLVNAYLLPLLTDKSLELSMCVAFSLPVFVSYILILLWKQKNEKRGRLAGLVTGAVFPICTGIALLLASIVVPLCLPAYAEVANGVRNGMALIVSIDTALKASTRIVLAS